MMSLSELFGMAKPCTKKDKAAWTWSITTHEYRKPRPLRISRKPGYIMRKAKR